MTISIGSNPAALNIAAVDPSGPGHLAVYPCAAGYAGTSSLNYLGGQTVANAAFVAPDSNGNTCVLASVSSVDVVVDRSGTLTRRQGSPLKPRPASWSPATARASLPPGRRR